MFTTRRASDVVFPARAGMNRSTEHSRPIAVFPARAGMNRIAAHGDPPNSVPRTRGDEPLSL